jgi:hypothetical protein
MNIWTRLKDWLFGKRTASLTPEMYAFEGLIKEMGGVVIPYIGLINPGGSWLFNESSGDFLKIIAFDYTWTGEACMVQRTGNVYYYMAINNVCFRCTL